MLLVSDPTPRTEIKDQTYIRALRVTEAQGQALKEIAQNYAVAFESGELTYDTTVLKHTGRVLSPGSSSIISKYRLLSEIDLVGALREFEYKLIEHELRRIQEIRELNKYRKFLKQLSGKVLQGKFQVRLHKGGKPEPYGKITKTLSKTYDRA